MSGIFKIRLKKKHFSEEIYLNYTHTTHPHPKKQRNKQTNEHVVK